MSIKSAAREAFTLRQQVVPGCSSIAPSRRSSTHAARTAGCEAVEETRRRVERSFAPPGATFASPASNLAIWRSLPERRANAIDVAATRLLCGLQARLIQDWLEDFAQ